MNTRPNPKVIDPGTMDAELKRGTRGFSMLELLIVVAIIAIIASIALINARRTTELAREQLVISKLTNVAELQMQYRVALGHRRYGTLAELRAAQTGSGPLMAPTLAPVDGSGNPVATGGWIIREPSAPTTATLQSSFSIEAVPATGVTATNRYCIFEDGAVRRAPVASNCLRTSTLVQ